MCLPVGKVSQQSELALYLMGQLRENLPMPIETAQSILSDLISLKTQPAVIVQLRSLWLLERIAFSDF